MSSNTSTRPTVLHPHVLPSPPPCAPLSFSHSAISQSSTPPTPLSFSHSAISRLIQPPHQHTLLNLLASCVNTQALSSSALSTGGTANKPLTMRRVMLLLVGFVEPLGGLPATLTPFAVGKLVEESLPNTNMFYLSQVLYVRGGMCVKMRKHA